MSNDVFANGNEIACKSGAGKVIAAFPDVCLSPPSPPAGPIPVPYPNTSFSKDMKSGSKTVKISGTEIMLKDQSFYKTSPLGDEPATRSFGGSVVTHVITGKTYFAAWSMDVVAEGENVDRHLDLTTSNHASPIGSTPPNPNTDAVGWGELEDDAKECACCGEKPQHAVGKPMDMDTWYTTDNLGNPLPAADVQAYKDLMDRVNNRKDPSLPPDKQCSCSGRVVPEPPCNVFRKTNDRERAKIVSDWDKEGGKGVVDVFVKRAPGDPKANAAGNITRPSARKAIGAPAGTQVNHLTPKSAGGCPTGTGNLQAHESLCDVCKQIDKDFGKLQNKPTLPNIP
jgi:hypothetical protein